MENHYVDDLLLLLLLSIDTPEEAVKLISDVKFVHQQGGFNIRNWISNSEEVICLNLNENKQVENLLGVFWGR